MYRPELYCRGGGALIAPYTIVLSGGGDPCLPSGIALARGEES